jgi:hypothetical protein
MARNRFNQNEIDGTGKYLVEVIQHFSHLMKAKKETTKWVATRVPDSSGQERNGSPEFVFGYSKDICDVVMSGLMVLSPEFRDPFPNSIIDFSRKSQFRRFVK